MASAAIRTVMALFLLVALILPAGAVDASSGSDTATSQPKPMPTAPGPASPTSGGDIILVAGSLRFDPAAPRPGDLVSILAEIQNIGNHTIQVAASVTVAEKNGPAFESIPLARFALGAGESHRISPAWTARDGGDYDVRVRAADAGTPSQASELQGVLTIGKGSVAHPTQSGNVALVAGSIGFSLVHPEPGETVAIYVRVENTGERPVGVSVEMRIGPAGGITDGVLLNPFTLAAGQGRVVSREWRVGPVGVYDIVVRAGPEGTGSFDMARLDGTFTVVDGATPQRSPELLLTSGLTNIGNLERGDARTVPVEVTAYNAAFKAVQLHVLDAGGLEANVLTPPTDVPAGQSVKFFVRLAAPAQENATPAESRRILLHAVSLEGSSNVESINLVLHERGFLGVPWLGAPTTLAALGAGVALAGSFRRK